MLKFVLHKNSNETVCAFKEGVYMAEIVAGRLLHVRSGISSDELRQIADKLDELNKAG